MNVRHFIGLWPLLLLLGNASSTLAQVIPDATLGAESSQLQLQGNQITIEGGANRGLALFHSFEQFNVADGQQVFFASSQDLDTILSRVTGTNPSNLDGTLGILGPADLFLLNPNGILFGPNAQLDLTGRFTASTADSLQIADFTFSATAPEPVPLLSINVLPGIQFGANAPDRLIQNQANLTLAPQQQLSFNGGTIQQAGQITIPGGTVDLQGNSLSLTGEINTRTTDNQFGLLRLSSPTDLTIEPTAPLTNQAVSQALQNNEVVVESDRNLTLIGSLSSPSLAPLTLTAGGNLSFLADGSGSSELTGNITLQSGNNLLIENPLHVTNEQNAPSVMLQAGGDVILRNIFRVPIDGLQITDGVNGLQLIGNDGNLLILAENLVLEGSNILTVAGSTGNRGQGSDVDIRVVQDVALEDGAIATRTGLGGNSGNIRIQAGNSVNADASFIFTGFLDDRFPGQTGSIQILAGETVFLGSSQIRTTSTSGNAGEITLTATDLLLKGSDRISLIGSEANLGSTGNAGAITINTTDSIQLTGNQPGPFVIPPSSEFSLFLVANEIFSNTIISAPSFGTGTSGFMQINTGQLILRDGALLGNASGLFQNGGISGDVVVTAQDIQLSGLATIGSFALGNGDGGNLRVSSDLTTLNNGAILAVSSLFGTGEAGQLNLDTNELMITGGSLVAANTEAGGPGGLLDIQARTITVEGTSMDGTVSSAILTDVSPLSNGPGGELHIQSDTLQVLNGGQIRATTRGSQNAGNIDITANRVTVNGTSPIGTPSTIEAQSTSLGEAGNIFLTADQFTVRDLATVSTQSLQGSGGDILLVLDNFLLLRQRGTISATAGAAGTEGDGGNITINAGFVVGPTLENSDITANAFEGTGGNVNVRTNALLGIAFRDNLTPLSDITASSELGLDGTVVIEQFVDEIEPDPIELPNALVSNNERLTAGCLLDEDASFVATGRGGIPANSGERLNQSLIWSDSRGTSTNGLHKRISPTPSPLTEAQRWQVNHQGQIELIALANSPALPSNLSCQSMQNPA